MYIKKLIKTTSLLFYYNFCSTLLVNNKKNIDKFVITLYFQITNNIVM